MAAAGAGASLRGRGARAAAGPGTLLVTVDAATPLPGRLGVVRLTNGPVAVAPGLDLLVLDRLSITESTWRDFTAVLGLVGGVRAPVPAIGAVAQIDAGEITALPGLDDVLLLRRIRDAATSGTWSRVVVDLSGCGDPFALLRAPATVSAYLGRLWPRHVRLASASDGALSAVVAAVEQIDADCRDLTELFADPHGAAIHLVVDDGERGAGLAARHLALTGLMGLPLASVFVDPIAPVAADTATVVRGLLGAAGIDAPVVELARLDVPLNRLARLRKLGVTLPGPPGRESGSAAAATRRIGGESLDSVFELSWSQLLPEPDRFALGRNGENLLVTVSGFRHALRLPPVLRRCHVRGAEYEGNVLRVQFVPDPAVWPTRPTR